jgi:hypothetical protein
VKPPRRLRIGHLTYKVRVDRQRCEAEDAEAISSGNEARIILRGDRPHDANADALLHEILHQCLFVAGIDVNQLEGGQPQEERLVRAMSGPLYAALRDNPALVAYLVRRY